MPDMHMTELPPFSWHVLLTTWQPNLVGDLLIAAALASYLAGLLVVRGRGMGGLPWYRIASFLLAILVLVLSVNTAIETYSHVLFWVHMVQHLLLIMVAPALLVVGGPLALLAQQGQARVRTALLSRPVALVTHPLAGLGIYSIVIVATHLTSFMQEMMLHPWLRQVEHLLYLGGGYLFLLALIGDEPIRWRPSYPVRILVLFLAMAPETVVGIVLLQSDRELFPAYAAVRRSWGPSPLDDLNRGGAIMWAFGDGLMMTMIVGVVLVYITHAATNATAGGYLEGVRRSTLATHLDATGEQADLDASDLDEDDVALAAYNRMLARLSGGAPREPEPSSPDRSSPSARAHRDDPP